MITVRLDAGQDQAFRDELKQELQLKGLSPIPPAQDSPWKPRGVPGFEEILYGLATVETLRLLFDIVQAIVHRNEKRVVKVTVGDSTFEVKGHSTAEERRMIEEMFERHRKKE